MCCQAGERGGPGKRGSHTNPGSASCRAPRTGKYRNEWLRPGGDCPGGSDIRRQAVMATQGDLLVADLPDRRTHEGTHQGMLKRVETDP